MLHAKSFSQTNTNTKDGFWEYVMKKSAQKSKNKASGNVPPNASPKDIPNYSTSTTSVKPSSNRLRSSCDSIGKEMTHFKPIRIMPISARTSLETTLRIPIVRYINNPENGSFFPLAKSKFKPEAPLKVRNSAFSLVPQPVITVFKGNKKQIITNANKTTHNQPNSYSVYNKKKTKQKLMCNILLEKTNHDKVLLQEKEDYALAKMLQEYDNDVSPTNKADTARSNNSDVDPSNSGSSSSLNILKTRRYFLRTRSKQTDTTAASQSKLAKKSNSHVNGNSLSINSINGVLNGKINKRVTRAIGKRKRTH